LVEIDADAGKICVKISQYADDKNLFFRKLFCLLKKNKMRARRGLTTFLTINKNGEQMY